MSYERTGRDLSARSWSPKTSSEDDDSCAGQFRSESRQLTVEPAVPSNKTDVNAVSLKFFGIGVVCAVAVGFAGGFLLASSSKEYRNGVSEKPATRSLAKAGVCRETYWDRARDVTPEAYLAVRTTQLQLINKSRDGDGWAPWQLAVQGNSAFKSECEETRTHPCQNNSKNPEWRHFDGGVWAVFIDPEKELAVGERYEDLELIETRFEVILTNTMREATLMHFHGLTPPSNLDGMPWISANPIQPNHTVFYDFLLYHRGFHWMHSHIGHHAGSGLYAPLIIKDHPDYLDSIGNPKDVLMILFDAHWRAPCAYARHLYPEDCPTGGFDSWSQYTFNVNGRSLQSGGNDVTNVSTVLVKPGEPVRLRVLDAGTMAIYRIYLPLKGRVLATDGRHTKPPAKNISDFVIAGANRIDVLLTMPMGEGCYPIQAVRASAWEKTSAHKSERGVLILKTANGVCNDNMFSPWALEDVKQITVDETKAFYHTLSAMHGVKDAHKEPDVHFTVRLTGAYSHDTGEWLPNFTINDRPLRLWPNIVWCYVPVCDTEDCEGPDHVENTVLNMKFCQSQKRRVSNVRCDEFKCNATTSEHTAYKRTKEGRCLLKQQKDDWEGVHVDECKHYKLRPAEFHYNEDALEVCHGDRVWITYLDTGTKEPHPVHLHGTHQQLIYINGTKVHGPWQDTWLVAPNSNLTVAFDAINPGEWLLHCHVEHHLMNGMAATLRYVMNGRCQKRLDEKAKAKWDATPPVQFEQWPKDWRDFLWKKKTPPKAGISTLKMLSGNK